MHAVRTQCPRSAHTVQELGLSPPCCQVLRMDGEAQPGECWRWWTLNMLHDSGGVRRLISASYDTRPRDSAASFPPCPTSRHQSANEQMPLQLLFMHPHKNESPNTQNTAPSASHRARGSLQLFGSRPKKCSNCSPPGMSCSDCCCTARGIASDMLHYPTNLCCAVAPRLAFALCLVNIRCCCGLDVALHTLLQPHALKNFHRRTADTCTNVPPPPPPHTHPIWFAVAVGSRNVESCSLSMIGIDTLAHTQFAFHAKEDIFLQSYTPVDKGNGRAPLHQAN